jgi:hypothetical protein
MYCWLADSGNTMPDVVPKIGKQALRNAYSIAQSQKTAIRNAYSIAQ